MSSLFIFSKITFFNFIISLFAAYMYELLHFNTKILDIIDYFYLFE